MPVNPKMLNMHTKYRMNLNPEHRCESSVIISEHSWDKYVGFESLNNHIV